MSTYKKITKHPLNGSYFNATWHDDYFGPHLYGVSFDGDKVVYPAEQVEQAQLKEFWVADVLEALRKAGNDEKQIIRFLAALQETYNERWDRDPEGGEGAVHHY